MGLEPFWLIPNGLFGIQTPAGERYIHFARSPLNSHLGTSLVRDKYTARAILAHHHLPNIPHRMCRTMDEARQFLAIHKTIIVKPRTGSGSRDIHIVSQPGQLIGLNIAEYICEKYVPGNEMRYLILNDAVIAVHHSKYGTSVAADRYLERISYPADQWDPALVAMTRRIADAFELRFAAVDFMIDANGRSYVLEINSTPGLKWFHAPTSGPAVDVARLFLESMLVADPAHQ
jgi:glutathione synthase/RimK-type ligase-like ATP-grasp enzyme